MLLKQLVTVELLQRAVRLSSADGRHAFYSDSCRQCDFYPTRVLAQVEGDGRVSSEASDLATTAICRALSFVESLWR